MQQHPGYRAADSTRSQRTQPALPAFTQPTVPIVAQTFPSAMAQPVKRTQRRRHTVVVLVGLAIILEGLYLALYPLLTAGSSTNDPFRQAIESTFPWISILYTVHLPILTQLLASVPWLSPRSGGSLHLLLLLLGAACVIAFIAARVGSQATRERSSRASERTLFSAILCITALLSLTLLCAPVGKSILAQDSALYGLYGRLVIIYHVNPYGVTLTAFPHDMLQALIISSRIPGIAPYGPMWLDVSMLIALLSQDSVANILLGFRLIGLIAHMVNVVLIWAILTRLKPELRISAMLLYAWNPAVLILSIAMMHQEVVIVLLVLLAVLFLQRNSPILAWVFILLAMLANPFCLLLLPLFLRILLKEARVTFKGQRFLCWLSIGGISALVVGLAYAPYWQGWGWKGLIAYLRQVFLPDTAMNSLDAALHSMPISPSAGIQVFTAPPHWAILTLGIVACILLFALWFADTLELILLFSSCLLLLLVILMPLYWPWYVIPPLALAICSTSRSTTSLALLLTLGALLSFFFLLGPAPWPDQALLTVGLPFLLWGWMLFFTSTWQMTRPAESEEPEKQVRRVPSFSRPPWLSRPSWPSRPGRTRR
jgi:hypothetical protein